MKRQFVEKVKLDKARSCGDCRLCCKLLKVGSDEEPGGFQKEQGKWCKHACAQGCAIYEGRPKVCVEYKCAWLGGLFREDQRPDKSKVVVSLEGSVGDELTDAEGQLVMAKGTPVWCVYEWTPGVAKHGKAKEIVEELPKVCVVHPDEPGGFQGPYPICIVPSATGLRSLKLPGMQRFVPCLRPDEEDPRVPGSMKQADVRHNKE